jgi:hypothetical protein
MKTVQTTEKSEVGGVFWARPSVMIYLIRLGMRSWKILKSRILSDQTMENETTYWNTVKQMSKILDVSTKNVFVERNVVAVSERHV